MSKPGGKFGPLGCSKASKLTSPKFVVKVASWGTLTSLFVVFSVSSSGSPKSEMSLLPTELTSMYELFGSESGTTEIFSTE